MVRLAALCVAVLLVHSAVAAYGQERQLSPLERAARQRGQPEQSAQPGPASAGPPQTWRVGPGQPLKMPSDAARQARTGDTVEIEAGTYGGDVAIWPQHQLTIRGVGKGRAVLKAEGQSAQGKSIWIVRGNEVRIERIEFADAKVRDKNGAGIRHEGGNLTIVDCVFRDNENSILSGVINESEMRIERSEFARNGHPNGYAHGLYIGQIRRLTLIGNYFHGTVSGHLVKTRAQTSVILYNRIMDEAEGRASYAIDLSDGGMAYVVGNLIQQGPRAENWGIISYMFENRHPKNELYVINNTIVNELGKGIFVRLRAGRAVVANNIIVGGGTLMDGPGELSNNLLMSFRGSAPTLAGGMDQAPNRGNLLVKDARLVDIARYDYRLAAGSPAAGAGMDPRDWLAKAPITLDSQYHHPRSLRKRRAGAPYDVGAFAAD